jgi:branched-chain amino acid transport system ATP-binding protein
MTVLAVEGLQKAYGNLVVTRNVSLEVAPGERHVIIGPNGAGKTSLIHQIGGQTLSDAGRIRLDGSDITRLSPEARAQMGLARTFQKNTLFSGLSVFENIRLGVQAHFGTTFDLLRPASRHLAVNARAETILDMLSLRPIAERTVSKVSYGDQRQVEIALALAGRPRVLLLDEPTSGLSPLETRQIIDVVKALPSGLGVLMIEHDMEVVFSIADRITVLYYGEVIATGPPEQISNDARVREVYLGAAP